MHNGTYQPQEDKLGISASLAIETELSKEDPLEALGFNQHLKSRFDYNAGG